jgi:hypothetical protein
MCIYDETQPIDDWEPTATQEAAMHNGFSSWAEISAHHYDPFEESQASKDVVKRLEGQAEAASVPFDLYDDEDCPF